MRPDPRYTTDVHDVADAQLARAAVRLHGVAGRQVGPCPERVFSAAWGRGGFPKGGRVDKDVPGDLNRPLQRTASTDGLH